MNRVCLMLLAAALGCRSAVPSIVTSDIAAALACEGSRAVLACRKAPPKPVVPSDVCQRCQGRGYIGDSASIKVLCPACKGTGKATR